MQVYYDLNTAFVEELVNLRTSGINVRSRGSEQSEILFSQFTLADPTKLQILAPARRFNTEYATIEWLWYLSQNPKVNNIGKYAKIWLDIQDPFGEVESNYGAYIFNHSVNQWSWVIEELTKDKDSRRATIAINNQDHKNRNPKDYPCTQYIQFFIRDDELHMGVYMRSNDAIFGFCNDVYTFCLFQQLMYNELKVYYSNLRLGSYFHSAGSFHVYERHYKMLDKICDNYYVNCLSNGYPVIDSTTLKPHITWDYIVKNNLSLPFYDMSKEEIKDFYIKTKEQLFDEYP